MNIAEDFNLVQFFQSRKRLWGLAAFAILLLVLLFCYGPAILDDAFITFRYARQFAEGHGFTYNPGEYVQGSSTPLFMLVLGVAASLGLNLPATAVLINYFAACGIVALLVAAGATLQREAAGWAAAIFLSLQFLWIVLLSCGMETILYSFLVFALLFSVASKRWRWTGPLMALCVLTRYDGVVACFAAGLVMLWQAGWKITLRQTAISLAIYLPWILFAWLYYGSPVPMTVKAKQVLHYIPWNELAFHYWYFADTAFPLWYLWLPLAAWGGLAIVKNSRASIVYPLWILLYLGILIQQRAAINGYTWYVVPVYPPLMFLAAYGGVDLLRKSTRFVSQREARRVGAAFLAGIAVWLGFQLYVLHGDVWLRSLQREELYRVTAQKLEPKMDPGDMVFMVEVGVLGWYLEDAVVIDGCGLMTPEVVEIRRQDREQMKAAAIPFKTFTEGRPEVTRQIIREFAPDFIAVRRIYMFLGQIPNEPFFIQKYKKVEDPLFDQLEIAVYQRKES